MADGCSGHDDSKARRRCAVLDVNNGERLSLVSLPAPDAASAGKGSVWGNNGGAKIGSQWVDLMEAAIAPLGAAFEVGMSERESRGCVIVRS